MTPSTWGWTVVDRRERTIPTNSVVCSTGRATSVETSTGMAGTPPAARLSAPPHATANAAAGSSERARTRVRPVDTRRHTDLSSMVRVLR